jgi:hypothetical protein
MAESTSERPASKAREEIIREGKRLEETTLHSAKGHHCAARRWGGRNLWLGLPAVIISTLAGGAAFTQASKETFWLGILAGICSSVVALLTAISTFLNPNEKENGHLTAAHAFDKLNNDARIFWSIECWRPENTDEALTARLVTLVETKDKLNSDSPQIPRWAYLEAKKGIEGGEASFKVDADPPPLALPPPSSARS